MHYTKAPESQICYDLKFGNYSEIGHDKPSSPE